MRKFIAIVLTALIIHSANAKSLTSLFIEAESFQNKGGWVVDQQFMDLMGSSYLMAHGLGTPVSDATTTVNFAKTGEYTVFVRTYNWTSPWTTKEGPGKFQLTVNGKVLNNKILGTKSNTWEWQEVGKVKISSGTVTVGLRDLTGFNGRCDAVYFTMDNILPPNEPEVLTAFRKEKLGLPEVVPKAGKFDLVVIGGGVAGTAAALTAARQGLKVALIQDRPVLGGNNSSEVRVHLGGRINLDPYPKLGDVVNEIAPLRGGNAQPGDYYEDEKKLEMVNAENNISLFLNFRAFKVEKEGTTIRTVFARHIETAEELSFSAPLFADCTGDGTIGYLAGADFAMGRESKAEFNEATAPEEADKMTMGSSVQWYSKEVDKSSDFPEFDYGIDFNETNAQKVTMGEWTWETGMNFDQISDFERIRDYGMLVVYSNWSYLKNKSSFKEEYKNKYLDWVAYIAGKRESRRLIGDMVLTEQDITDFVIYPDASAPTSWTIDLHYPDPKNTKHFPGAEFKSIAVHKTIHPYPIPYRCFYSRNVDNLFMAGRNISVTHVALGTVRVMRTTGMMGEVVGMAATVAAKNKTNPRGVYQKHLDKLQRLMTVGAGKYNIENIQNYNLGGTLGPKKINLQIPPYDKD
ncbi:MAG: FAD-dependent oxidoreductase [Petrimonas sp.]|uniref:FAD-dependent oxidoreductase n=1 Tax=Petrimonas sp. TaxID=2023866 RepID=UPI002B3DF465|nr:FAD-dependent oxidoreductase [Petrimonas sp.]